MVVFVREFLARRETDSLTCLSYGDDFSKSEANNGIAIGTQARNREKKAALLYAII